MELVITEKPSVAKSICRALNITDNSKSNDGFIEGDGYIISWCVGHLMELATPEQYDPALKRWSFDSLPIFPDKWRYEVKKETKKQYGILKMLMERKDVSGLINACDSGREGELIFRLVYMNAGCKKPFKRLWISSMEDAAIRDGFSNLYPSEKFDALFKSALARQKADWLVGINCTRLFTTIYRGKVLKVGRVQSPTLAMIVDRDTEICLFKKEPFYTLHLKKGDVDAVSEKFKEKDDAEKLKEECSGKNAVVSDVSEEEKRILPPKLYDLTSLQRDANRIFGFSAKQTLDYAQSLYEAGYITYPRTDSRYLTSDMKDTAEYSVKLLFSKYLKAGECPFTPDTERILDSSKVSDHHALIPTMKIGEGDLSAFSDGEKKVYALIAIRLITSVARAHIYRIKKCVISCGEHEFSVSGKSVVEEGFKEYEKRLRNTFRVKDDEEETPILSFNKGDVLTDYDLSVIEGFTRPPSNYTEDTLLKDMEKAGTDEMENIVERRGLGTPATRADIIEKLVKEGFLKRDKKNLISTDEGRKLITILPDILKNAKMTADWENALLSVADGRLKSDDFLGGIKDMIDALIKNYEDVASEIEESFFPEAIGVCPKCGGRVLYGKYGAYCEDKCGIYLSRAFGKVLSAHEVASLLKGDKVLIKGIKARSGNLYDIFLTVNGLHDFTFTNKKGEELSGVQLAFEREFPQKQKK